jgi:hypothetical protein
MARKREQAKKREKESHRVETVAERKATKEHESEAHVKGFKATLDAGRARDEKANEVPEPNVTVSKEEHLARFQAKAEEIAVVAESIPVGEGLILDEENTGEPTVIEAETVEEEVPLSNTPTEEPPTEEPSSKEGEVAKSIPLEIKSEKEIEVPEEEVTVIEAETVEEAPSEEELKRQDIEDLEAKIAALKAEKKELEK